MVDDRVRGVAETVGETQRSADRWAMFDELLVAGIQSGGQRVVEIEAGGLGWWRMRRRLARRYGVVAVHVGGSRWALRGSAQTQALRRWSTFRPTPVSGG